MTDRLQNLNEALCGSACEVLIEATSFAKAEGSSVVCPMHFFYSWAKSAGFSFEKLDALEIYKRASSKIRTYPFYWEGSNGSPQPSHQLLLMFTYALGDSARFTGSCAPLMLSWIIPNLLLSPTQMSTSLTREGVDMRELMRAVIGAIGPPITFHESYFLFKQQAFFDKILTTRRSGDSP